MCVASLVTGLKNWLYLKNELIELTDILHAGTNSGKLEVISKIFWVGLFKNGRGHLVHETHLLSEFMDWANFLHADYDAIIFD